MAEQHGKTLVPQIRFAGFTDPWEQRKLGELYQKNDERNTDGLGSERTLSVASMTFNSAGNGADDSSLPNYKRLRLGDIAFEGHTNKEFAYGRFVLNDAGNGIMSPRFTCLRPIVEQEYSFWKYFIHSEKVMRPILVNSTKSGTMMNELVVEDFLKQEILVPSLPEQRRIGAFFDRLDSLITLHQRKYDKLCVLKKSMLDKMFPKGGSLYPEIRFAGFTDPWEQRKLGDVARRVTRKNENRDSDLPLTISAQYGLVDQRTFFNNQVASKDMSGYFLLHKGEFAYNKSTSTDSPWGAIKRLEKYDMGCVSTLYICFELLSGDPDFLVTYYETDRWYKAVQLIAAEGARNHGLLNIAPDDFFETQICIPKRIDEQRQIGAFFDRLDSLITLHQRKYDGCTLSPIFFRKVHTMQENITSESLFCDYYAQWVRTYKEGAIRDVTMGKYRLTQSWLSKLIPELRLADMDRTAYQQLINGYAQHHERQTTMDFHHQIKGAILDAVDEGLIPRDPTRKVIIKGKQPRIKKMKYLNQFELHAMLADLDLGDEASWDWLILLIAKTGLRFSEALGLTPDDFDFAHQTLSVNKTWDYKNGGGFVPTKNESSVRKVQLDWQLIMQMSGLLKDLPHDKPIFVHGKVYNSTANDVLAKHCRNVDVPVISVHGLRHTHASLLLFAGVSIASVSRRLGHASMTTTQETYLHVIRELENKDVDIVMRALSTLI